MVWHEAKEVKANDEVCSVRGVPPGQGRRGLSDCCLGGVSRLTFRMPPGR